jgi:hypothetical protein
MPFPHIPLYPLTAQQESERKQRLDRLYAEVKNRSFYLYERCVILASITFPDNVKAAAQLEANLLGLVSEAYDLGADNGR